MQTSKTLLSIFPRVNIKRTIESIAFKYARRVTRALYWKMRFFLFFSSRKRKTKKKKNKATRRYRINFTRCGNDCVTRVYHTLRRYIGLKP